MYTVVITGATKGIGRSLSIAYASQCVQLVLIARDEQLLKALSEECRVKGAKAHYYLLDLSNTEEAIKASSEIAEEYDVDLLISNAGITGMADEGEVEPWTQIESILSLNCTGAIAITHSILIDMQNREAGQVAYISSIAAYHGMPLTPAYCASKSAIKAYAEAIRGGLASKSVMITLVTPGFVETDMSDQFPSKKPFMVSADEAAKVIKKGLDRKKRVISFPLILTLGMKCLVFLPAFVSDYILSKFKY